MIFKLKVTAGRIARVRSLSESESALVEAMGDIVSPTADEIGEADPVIVAVFLESHADIRGEVPKRFIQAGRGRTRLSRARPG